MLNHPNSQPPPAPAPSSDRSGRDYSLPTTRYSLLLISYFRSGWAFLIPYLAAYLLYAWLKWPVNPASGEGIVKVISESGTVVDSQWSVVPPLLHVYWFLHGIHLVLGSLALRAWWRESGTTVTGATDDSENSSDHATSPQPSTVPHSGHRPPSLIAATVYRLLPWLCLALLFYIPGVYLEWPSDPWEHLRRINEWHVHDLVMQHSAWMKSSYFIPYSMLSWTIGLKQIYWLDFYNTGICLLLCWQYYRLARACDLGKRASMMFVLLNALTFGNNIFSFYRYYGISSSIYAQLGAVALTRIALEAMRGKLETGGRSPNVVGLGTPIPTNPSVSGWLSRLPSPVSGLLQIAGAGIFLLPLIAFNHVQGFGIAAFGIAAVLVWRLIEWRRSMIGWLALAAVLLSIATVRWFPRHPALDEIYRPQGWLTTWYGFNFFSPASPAFERSFQIFGFFGLLNLGAGLWLLRRNHLAGWLTLMPLLALFLPCFALPFAHMLAAQSSSPGNIITFHRFLLAVPTGLALVAALSRTWYANTTTARRDPADNSHPSIPCPRPSSVMAAKRSVHAALVPIALLLCLTFSPGKSAYNRFWHSLQVVPDDMQLAHLIAFWTPEAMAFAKKDSTLVYTSLLGAEVQEAFKPSLNLSNFRQIHTPLYLLDLEQRSAWFKHAEGEKEKNANNTHTPANLVSADATWVTISGPLHKRVSSSGIRIIYNSPGATTSVFNSELIPVSADKRYLLSSTIRQLRSPVAINYLAVIWYDHERRQLESHLPQPEGAGAPAGWSNGTYSYYGLVGEPAPTEWTEYSIAFGLGRNAAIPPNAAFMRVGALLNYSEAPEAEVQINKVRIQENFILHHLIQLPSFRELYSPTSQAAHLSGHWPDQRVFVDHAGVKELRGHIPTASP